MTRTVAAPTIEKLDAVFKGFADPTRIRILNVLAAGELCVRDVVELLRLPQPSVSRHLAYLRRMGLVEATREWKYAHYRLAEPTHIVHRSLIQCVRTCFRGIPSLDKERARAEARVQARAMDPAELRARSFDVLRVSSTSAPHASPPRVRRATPPRFHG